MVWKWTGKEFLLATILGTGKPIDFSYFLYFILRLAITLNRFSLCLLVSLNNSSVLYLIRHWHCLLIEMI